MANKMQDFTGKWWVSQNEEWFSTGPFNSREDAISEGRAMYGNEAFWIAESEHFLDLINPDIDSILEKLEESILEISSVDDQQIDLSKEDKSELQEVIKKFLRERATIKNFAISKMEWIEEIEEA